MWLGAKTKPTENTRKTKQKTNNNNNKQTNTINK